MGAVTPLPSTFYARDALDVAVDAIGCEVEHAGVRLRITEVEAYRYLQGAGDTANHARAGRTARNAPMWGPPGHAYVYLCYGLHHMLNLVTNADGEAAAVLVRAAEIVGGHDLVVARRGGRHGRVLLTGPGKVAQALALTTAHSGARLDGAIAVYPRSGPVPALLHGPRVGIDYASEADRLAPWRIAMAGTRWVSAPKGLVPRG